MPDKGGTSLVVNPLPDCPPEIGRALWMLEDARRRTRTALKGFNSAHVDWAIEPGGMSVGTLLYHIAAIELDWLYSDVLQSEWPESLVPLFSYDVRDDQGKLTSVRGKAYGWYWTGLAAVRWHLLAAFRNMTLEDFRRPRSLPKYDVTPEWVLHHLCQHEAEHRSELAALCARAGQTEKQNT